MEIKTDDIDELAEGIVLKYSTEFPINPIQIASKLKIEVIEGNYETFFKGLIKYANGCFYILLNLDILKNRRYAMARYTCSHELGHFFLPNHRRRLKLGQSIAFSRSELKDSSKKVIEDEAQQFGASLLMPKAHFNASYLEFGKYGFEAILALKTYYEVSVSAALIRFTHLNLQPSISIFWNEQGIINKGVSRDFETAVGSKEIFLKLNLERPLLEEENVTDELTGVEYKRSFTPLSSWCYNLPKEMTNEYFVLEETQYSKWYNLTLLTIDE